MTSDLIITGAREHNLKDISLRLPRDRFIVITGLSGSGKSSLAFDTIYAEGQRRYVESLSAYARQFLGQMDKPDVDSIEGLSPAISIDQKTTSRNPRSTVGTVTEIYDYLRLLYARVGHPHCPKCGRPIFGQSVQQIVDQVCELEPGTRFSVIAPVVRGRKGEYGKLFEQFRADGFTRVKVDGEVRELEEDIELDKKFKHDIAVVVDRLVMKDGLRRRLTDSVETAAALADGLVDIELAGDDEHTLTFSEKFACIHCGISLPEIEPRIFSFNTPHGACPACHGLGFTQEIDPDLVVPDGSISIDQGALLPYGQLSFGWLEQVFESIAKTFGVDTGVPWDDMSEDDRKLFLYGTGKERIPLSYRNYQGRMRHYNSSFPGIIKHLERRFVETESEQVRQKIEEYMADRPCPECHGARLKPTSLAVTVGERNIHEFTLLSVRESLAFLEGLSLSDTERLIGGRVIKEIGERLRFLNDVGVGYLSLQRASATLSGGEAQRIRLATQIGSALVGVLYILDEPSIGLHQRDNRRLIDTLLRLRDLGNTVIVVEHDEETMRLADHIVDMGPGAGEHGGHVVAQGTPRGGHGRHQSRSPATISPAGAASSSPASGACRCSGSPSAARACTTSRTSTSRSPCGAFTCVTGVSGSGKSTLVNEILHKGMAARLNRGTKLRAGEHDGIDGARAPRQGHRHRPVAHRPHAAQQPGHLHGRVRPHPPALRADAREQAARLQARPLQLQRQGRPLRDVQGRRADQDRDALPARRLRALRGLQRQALQPRHARGLVQGQEHRRGARDERRGVGGVLRQRAAHRPPSPGARRRRAWATSSSASRRRRSPAARPSGSSSPASSARSPPARRSTSSTSPPPACTSPTSTSCSRCSSGSSTRATPWSSSSTTSTSSRAPTGSSTSAPRAATRAVAWSRPARRRSLPACPSSRTPASSSRGRSPPRPRRTPRVVEAGEAAQEGPRLVTRAARAGH